MVQLCLAGYVTLLVLAAVGDARERRIPNWLTGGVAALYPVYALASPTAVPWLAALGVAGCVLVVGFVLFAMHALGGGDVKLITAVSLWAGLDHLAVFALVTSLAGGTLALASILLRRWGGLIGAHVWALGLATSRAAMGASEHDPGPAADEPAADSLPYGIAIAAGGLAVAVNLLTH